MAFVVGLARVVSRIGKLQQALDELGTMPRKVAEIAAPRISRLLTRQFQTGTDPYGRAWKPVTRGTLAARKSGKRGPPLTDTGKLRGGTTAKLMPGNGRGVRLVLGASYGYFHQVGTKRMPARPIFPAKGIPAAWRDEMTSAAKSEFRRIMQRAK